MPSGGTMLVRNLKVPPMTHFLVHSSPHNFEVLQLQLAWVVPVEYVTHYLKLPSWDALTTSLNLLVIYCYSKMCVSIMRLHYSSSS